MLTEPPLTNPPLPSASLADAASPLASDPRNPSLAAAAVDAAGPMIGQPNGDTWRDTFAFFRKLSAYLKPYKTRFILGELAGVAFAFFNASIPLLMNAVFNHVGTAAQHPAKHMATRKTASLFGQGVGGIFNHIAETHYGILLICSVVPGIMILRGLCDYLNNYLVAWISLKVLGDMRRQIFAHINSQSLQFFLGNRSGNLISRVSNDTRVAQTALGFIGTDLIKQPITVVGCAYALLLIDWKFTLVSLVLFPLCIVPVSIYGKRIRKSGKKEEEQAGLMTVILQETFAGIRVIKSFAREDYQVAQFDDANISQFETSIRVRKATEIVSPMVEVVAALGVGLALLYVHYAGMELTTFFSLAAGMFLLYAPVKQLSRMHMQIQKCRAATANIFALLELKPTVQDAPDAKALPRPVGEVEFEQINFQYEGASALALNNFHLRIKPGKTIALVGESGAGKSTVLALLQRFYDPLNGSIRIDGQDVCQVTQRSLREQIGVVTQDTFLFNDTIYENIRYGRLDATEEEIYAAAKQAYIHDFILTLPEGYQTTTGDKGCRLSGGQQQRLAIARALLKNAPILLLDEATSALDSESERMIQTSLETLSKGKTVIAIAHRLSTILKADQIIVMDAGQIVEKGRHAYLYEQGGRYRRLYDLQFDHEVHLQEMQAAIGSSVAVDGDEVAVRPMSVPVVTR